MGCSGYDEPLRADDVDTELKLSTAFADASIECIDITSDITVTTTIDVPADKVIRITTSTGAALDGGRTTDESGEPTGGIRIMTVNSGAIVDVEGLTFKNGFAVRTRPSCGLPPGGLSLITLPPSTRPRPPPCRLSFCFA